MREGICGQQPAEVTNDGLEECRMPFLATRIRQPARVTKFAWWGSRWGTRNGQLTGGMKNVRLATTASAPSNSS